MKSRSYSRLLLIVAVIALSAAILPALSQEPAGKSNVVYVIPIKGAIMDKGLPYFVERAVNDIKPLKPSLIIFEIDTPGGAVAIGENTYTERIVSAIDRASPIPTAAYINTNAASAGALISITCDRIVMKPEGAIGAAEVVGAEAHQGKYTSYFANMFKARAEKKGYPVNLVKAMVDKDWDVREATVNDKREFLTPSEIDGLKKEGKKVKELRTVTPLVGKQPLTLSAKEAKDYGLASAIVNDISEIPALFNIANPDIRGVSPTWSESLVRIITDPVVSGILILIGLIAAWMAFQTPGLGIPEAVVVVCFFLVFFGHYLAGLAGVMEIVLFIIGLGLIAVEIFIIPGFGVPGIIGIIMVLVSLVLAMQDFTIPSPDVPGQWAIFQQNLLVVTLSCILAVVALVVLVRYVMPSNKSFRRLILSTEESDQSGFTSALPEYQVLIGKEGVVVNYLRPSGKIKIGEQLLDVVAEGEFINKGERVRVSQIEGTRIIVTKI